MSTKSYRVYYEAEASQVTISVEKSKELGKQIGAFSVSDQATEPVPVKFIIDALLRKQGKTVTGITINDQVLRSNAA